MEMDITYRAIGTVLWAIPLDGSPQKFLPLPAGAVRVMHETDGIPTCYLVLARTAGSVVGNSDTLCAIPGLSALSAANPRRMTIGDAERTVNRLVTQVRLLNRSRPVGF